MNIESPKVTVQKSAEYLFNALSNVNNYEVLMPDTIAKFEILGDDIFNFGLKGMPEIKLKMKEKLSASKVILAAASDKLPFTLAINIETISENESDITLDFDGEFNAMIGMMIKAPITNFLETLANNMHKL